MQIEKGSRVDRTLEPFQYTLLLGGYEKLTPREDEIRSLIFDVQSNIYLGFKVRKVPKAERLPLDVFDEFIGRFQLSVGIWKLHGVRDVRFIL